MTQDDKFWMGIFVISIWAFAFFLHFRIEALELKSRAKEMRDGEAR